RAVDSAAAAVGLRADRHGRAGFAVAGAYVVVANGADADGVAVRSVGVIVGSIPDRGAVAPRPHEDLAPAAAAGENRVLDRGADNRPEVPRLAGIERTPGIRLDRVEVVPEGQGVGFRLIAVGDDLVGNLAAVCRARAEDSVVRHHADDARARSRVRR